MDEESEGEGGQEDEAQLQVGREATDPEVQATAGGRDEGEVVGIADQVLGKGVTRPVSVQQLD